ncbi:MAG: ligand-binding sensor domain-containing protein, partial [Planctomycetota bacterium]
PPPIPPPTWQSYYGHCRVEGIDANGSTAEIWVGTQSNGFRYFNGASWAHFLTENSGILSNQVRDVAVDASGVCWIATDVGISLFDGSAFTSYTNLNTGGGLPSDDVTCLYLDAAGGMWVGTAASGAVRYFNSVWESGYTTTQGMASNSVTCIAEDLTTPTRRVWFGHDSANGLSIWDGSAFSTLDTGDGLSNGNVNGIDFDSGNVGWIATNNGLNSVTGVTFSVYNTGNSSLPHNNVQDVDVSLSDLVWVATQQGGAASLQAPSAWNTYTTANGLFTDETYHILADKGSTVRVGTRFGLNWYVGSVWSGDILGIAPLSHWNIRDIHIEGSGAVWYATEYGVTRQNTDGTWDAWGPATTPLSGSYCASIYVDSSSVAWIGNSDFIAQGLDRFDGSGWQNFNTSNSNLPNNRINDIVPNASGDMWLATNAGVSLFDGTSTFTNYDNTDGLGNNLITCLGLSVTGTVWAGTLGGGLSRFDGTSSWTTFTTTNGLPSNFINSIAFDSAGIWVATPLGVAHSTDNGTSWNTHNVASLALPSNDARRIAVSPDGDVYVATFGGVAFRTGTTWIQKTAVNSGLLSENLVAMTLTADGKTVYLGTNNAGICLYRPVHAQ